ATRDEFYEPYVPPFARSVWPSDAAQRLVTEKHTYNERSDLPKIPPMTGVTVRLGQERFTLPVLGCRLPLRPECPSPFATFEAGSPAGAVTPYGRGKVVALGVLPMLAYGKLAGFKPTTLEETWPPEPRALIRYPLTLSRISPVVRTNIPVIEASLLT